MSGSIAAIAAYDGSGTQGYGTTDEISAGVKSVFWNEKDTDKYYVNGCSCSEVSSNKGEITSPTEAIIFTFDNDSDAINDLTLAIERTGVFVPGSTTPYYHMLYFIERIEICIGNQVICTLSTPQLVKEFFDTGETSLFENYTQVGALRTPASAWWATPAQVLEAEAGVATGEAFLAQKRKEYEEALAVEAAGGTAADNYPVTYAEGSLRQLEADAATEAEKYLASTVACAQIINLNIFRMLSNNGMDSSYLMSCADNQTLQLKVYPQNFTKTEFNSYVNNASEASLLLLDNPKFTFSLYANKYSMTNAERDILRNQVVPKRTNITQYAELTSKQTGTLAKGSPITINCDHFNLYTSNLYILGLQHHATPLGGFDVELYLNSTSYSGIIPYYISSISSTAGSNFFYYKIPISKNSHMKETDQAYVPFSKFDSIRVVLTPKKDIVVADYKDFFDTLTVVAEGKCTALYQNGTVVFNNY